MAKIPGQRKAGQRGGTGGQLTNRGASYSRGGRPSAGGGGTGAKPPRSGCLFAAGEILAIWRWWGWWR